MCTVLLSGLDQAISVLTHPLSTFLTDLQTRLNLITTSYSHYISSLQESLTQSHHKVTQLEADLASSKVDKAIAKSRD